MVDLMHYGKVIKDEIKASFVNNKFILIFSVIIFVVPLLLSYFYPGYFESYLSPIIDEFSNRIADGTVTLSTDSLFINNFTVAIILYAGSALFAVVGAFVLFNNGLLIGYFGTQMDLMVYLALVLPHGIFEIPAIIIACAAGFVLLKFAILLVWNIVFPDKSDENYYRFFDVLGLSFKDRFMLSLGKHQNKILESFILLCIATVLLIVAAYIEANLTVPIAKAFLSLFGISI